MLTRKAWSCILYASAAVHWIFASFATFFIADWNAYTAETEAINLEVMDIVESMGLGFAFPSTSVYIESVPTVETTRCQAHQALCTSIPGSGRSALGTTARVNPIHLTRPMNQPQTIVTDERSERYPAAV